MPNRVAIYPGSFDPPTLGHLDLIERAASMFTKLIVAVATNPLKDALFTPEERVEMLKDLVAEMPNVSVEQFGGLTVDFADEKGALALIRGLRAMSDFEYELSLAINNRKLNPDVDTVCLMPSEPFLFLSSRQVKEIATFGGNIDHCVSPAVKERIQARLKELES